MQKYLKVARKHILSLICGVIALTAVILAFYPTGGWFTDLQTKVQQRVSVNSKIITLMRPNRHTLPNVNENSNISSPLTVFPTEGVIRTGVEAVKKVRDSSNDILGGAVKFNQHIPLDKDVLPAGDDIARATFRRDYLAALTEDARFRAWPTPDVVAARSDRHIPALLPGRRVSDDEIKKALDDLRAEIDKKYLVTSVVDGHVTPESKEQADQVYLIQSAAKPLELQMNAARKCKVYLEPGAIKKPEVYAQFVGADTSLRIGDVWAAQLALWIDEDVITGVAYANANSPDVTESPVKQIMDVTLKNPLYVVKDDPKVGKDDAALPKAFDMSPTGRECNGMYDVVQYNLTLDVDAAHIPAVLDSLEQLQFITVLSVKVVAIDTSEVAIQRYMYGNHTVVRLTVTCEELFMHEWMKDLQPPNTGPISTGQPGGFVGGGGFESERSEGANPQGGGPINRRRGRER